MVTPLSSDEDRPSPGPKAAVPAQPLLQQLTALAAQLGGTPGAWLSLVREDGQRVHAAVGLVVSAWFVARFDFVK